MSQNTDKKFSLDILGTIKTAQMANGLRHGDYVRYRVYCAKRIRRIRKKLHFLHGAKFRAKTITEHTVTSVGYLDLVLNYAERCWAHSMALKEDVDNPRSKFYAAKRLAKAAKWAQLLETLCNATTDERTKIEAVSYHDWLVGNIMLDKGDYAGAVQKLTRSMTVYIELGKVGTMKQQELCKERVSEIEPTIRFCNFNLGQSGNDTEMVKKILLETEATHAQDMLKSKLDSVLAETRKKEAQSMREVEWRNERIAIRNDKCRVLIINANDISFELNQMKEMDDGKLQMYDRLANCYNDAIKLVKDDIAQLKSTKMNIKKEGELKSLENLEEYLTYQRVEKVYERNLKLATQIEEKVLQGTLKSKSRGPKADEAVKCYETVITNVLDLGHLKDFDEEAKRIFAADHLSFKAIRCFFVGLSYMNVEKWHEAMALFSHCETHLRTAVAHQESAKENATAVTAEKLEMYKRQAMAFGITAHAKGFLAQQAAQKAESDKAEPTVSTGLLLDNLDKYTADFLTAEGGPKLVDFPPKLEPITCKPLLFDLALSECAFPDLTERKKAPRTGFFSRLWG